MDKIVIVGGGGHAGVVISILKKTQKYEVCGYVDIHDNGAVLDVPYLGMDKVLGELIKEAGVEKAAICVGRVTDSSLRKRLIEQTLQMGYSFPSIESPDAIVNDDVVIGSGSVVMDGAVINCGTRIGAFAIINTSASVDHDCEISDFAHIGPGVVLCGGVTIGEDAFIGAGAVVCQNRRIKEGCVVGAGAVVTDDCIDMGTYVGVPAGRIR
jgi:sugar O-acyltransferase (sialic acid O-acetyltransferase NeuD family)